MKLSPRPFDDLRERYARDLFLDLEQQLPLALQFLSAVPDQTMRSFLGALARDIMIGGRGRTARRQEVERTGIEVLRALSRGWDAVNQGTPEPVDVEYLELGSEQALFHLARIV